MWTTIFMKKCNNYFWERSYLLVWITLIKLWAPSSGWPWCLSRNLHLAADIVSLDARPNGPKSPVVGQSQELPHFFFSNSFLNIFWFVKDCDTKATFLPSALCNSEPCEKHLNTIMKHLCLTIQCITCVYLSFFNAGFILLVQTGGREIIRDTTSLLQRTMHYTTTHYNSYPISPL